MVQQKKHSRDPFTEFLSVFEKQRMEMEKLAKPFLEYPKQMEKIVKPFLEYQQRSERLAKPILEYHQKLLEESKRFQEALAQNVVATIRNVINQMMEEQKKQAEQINRLLAEVKLPSQTAEYLKGLNSIQERWIEQLRKATEVLERFVKIKEAK
jgi:uncharacterized protein with ATP-grasp and redox domains